MSVAKIWMRRALEVRSEIDVIHFFVQMKNDSPSKGFSGVYCRTPALDGFNYDNVQTVYAVDFHPSRNALDGKRNKRLDQSLRYLASGPAVLQPHRAPTCDACRFAWEAYREWKLQ